MSDLKLSDALPPSSQKMIDVVSQVEKRAQDMEQVSITTDHVIHDGVYTRTICVPAGVMITGALIKISTTLIVSGTCTVLIGDGEEIQVSGYMVMPTSSGRKQIFMAHTDTFISMIFKTDAKSVEEAEAQFTDDVDILKSKVNPNDVRITGG